MRHVHGLICFKYMYRNYTCGYESYFSLALLFVYRLMAFCHGAWYKTSYLQHCCHCIDFSPTAINISRSAKSSPTMEEKALVEKGLVTSIICHGYWGSSNTSELYKGHQISSS